VSCVTGRVTDGRQTSAEPGSGRVPSPGPGLRRRPGWRMSKGSTERRRGASSVSTAPGGYCRGRRPEPAAAMAGERPASWRADRADSGKRSRRRAQLRESSSAWSGRPNGRRAGQAGKRHGRAPRPGTSSAQRAGSRIARSLIRAGGRIGNGGGHLSPSRGTSLTLALIISQTTIIFDVVMVSVSRMCIRLRRGRQRPRDRCHAESRQATPKFPPVIGAGGRLPGCSGCAGRAVDYTPPRRWLTPSRSRVWRWNGEGW
jgi:hypothetical protein